jgi:predicted nucleotidyltransferase
MVDVDLEHDLNVLRAWAEKDAVVLRLWLYGSRARGNHRPDSDLDIAIEHTTARGDADVFTTALCTVPEWAEQLQSRMRLQLHLQSRHETEIVERGVRDCSQLIYEGPV